MGCRQRFSLYIITIALGGLFYFSLPLGVQASHGGHLVISELQAGGATTEDEFVELYNPTGAAVDISTWSIQYKSATGTTFQKKNFDPGTSVPAHGFFLIARSDYHGVTPADMTQGSFLMSASGGHVFLVGNQTLLTSATDSAIVDKVGYGTANAPEGTAAIAPPANQSIERKPGGSGGNDIDTNNNAADFQLQTTPNPQNKASTPVPTISSPPSSDGSSSSSSSGSSSSGSPASAGDSSSSSSPQNDTARIGDILINEFMPDPTDGMEWVELYNKTSAVVDLTGWKLFDGTDATVKTLNGTIASSGYVTFDLASARLNNSGDRIFLKSPQSTTIDAVSYGDWNDGNVSDNAPAPTTSGQSVARKSNGVDSDNDKNDFATTDSPTKNAPNIITVTQTVSVRSNASLPQSAFTPKLQIVINEFVSDPEDGPEWVELYNAGNLSVDLEGWWLEDGSEAKTKLTGTIVPEHFKVFSDISGSLNNKGDIIRLKNEKGEVVDRVTYGIWEDGTPSDNAPVAEDSNALARIHDGQDSDRDNEDFAVTTKPTKGKVNTMEAVAPPSPRSSPIKGEEGTQNSPPPVGGVRGGGATATSGSSLMGNLSINEFLPNPAGTDDEEWIELYYGGAEPFALKGLQLDDGEGGSKPFVFDTEMVGPYSFLLLPKSKTHLTLNNQSDAVRLLTRSGAVLDSVEYEDTQKDAAYAKGSDGAWRWTTTRTPGAGNIITAVKNLGVGHGATDSVENEAQAISLADLQTQEPDSKVSVEGIVSAPPGIFGKNIFYLSTAAPGQAGSGAQVYAKHGLPDNLRVGTSVALTGTVQDNHGEMRIAVGAADELNSNGLGKPPEPRTLAGAPENTDAGSLVQVEGTLLVSSHSHMTLDNGQEIAVVIKKGASIEVARFILGETLRVTGIVIPEHGGANYAVAPRSQKDIVVIKSASHKNDSSVATQKDLGMQNGSASPPPSPYTKATTYTAIGTSGAVLALRRRKLFTTSLRTALSFLRNRGKKNSVV